MMEQILLLLLQIWNKKKLVFLKQYKSTYTSVSNWPVLSFALKLKNIFSASRILEEEKSPEVFLDVIKSRIICFKTSTFIGSSMPKAKTKIWKL